jgi:hypothetical protein
MRPLDGLRPLAATDLGAISMIRKLLIFGLPWCIALTGCASTYQYAKNVKYVSFDGNLAEGKGVGPVRGESCQAFVMGYAIGEAPTLDKAVADARTHSNLRYLVDVATDNAGFDAYVYRKYCLVVKGTGYQ